MLRGSHPHLLISVFPVYVVKSVIFNKSALKAVLSIYARARTHRRTTRLDLLYQSPVKHEFVVIVMTSELLVLD